LESDPHRIDATRILAHIAMSNRAYDEALPYLRQIAAAEPGDRSNRVELATACAQTSHPEEALHLLQPALQEGYPDEKGSLHAMLGQVFRTLGREQEAVQSFAQARSLSDAYQSRVRRTGDDQH
jgi:predicted Zn-dependent protease